MRSPAPSRLLALIAHLHCTVLAKQLACFRRAIRTGGYPHTKITVTESWIVTHRERQPWNPCKSKQAKDGGQRADEHHELEADDGVWHPTRDGLAAHDERPVVGNPDRNPV